MFKRRRKKPQASNNTVVKEQTTKEIIEEIHDAFNTASHNDKLEAEKLLSNLDLSGGDKADRLKGIGFHSTKQVVDHQEKKRKVELSKETVDQVNYFSQKYPTYKFITQANVTEICKKYGLVCGGVELYTGFVPEKNLQEIEKFDPQILEAKDDYGYESLMPYDVDWEPVSRKTNEKKEEKRRIRDEERKKAMEEDDGYTKYYHALYAGRGESTIRKRNMLVCAPVKDMEITGSMVVGSDMMIKEVHIPDPVVLYPVAKNGYLIITAWGDEASDPAVVNEKMN